MISLQHVTKAYEHRGQRLVAFQVDQLSIPPGDYLAVVGPSGSGKTTFLSMLGGMLSPSEGSVWFEGQSLYELRPAERTSIRRRRIGFVFQTFNLVPYLTALENVRMPLYLIGHKPAEQRERALELLARVGLADRVDHKPSELSTGQQQRVALARTLANNPAVILADEPTGNLDPESREMVLAFLDEAHREGRTIVTVTHDVAGAGRAARLLRLRDGNVESVSANQLKVAC